MRKRLVILVGVALCAALTIPSLASAHTGSVSCTTAGVVFSYNANFSHDTLVTETVGGAVRGVTVKARTASTDTWAGVTGTISAGASWTDGNNAGSIPATSLTCPPVDTPPVTQTCPEGTTQESATPGMLVCIRTVTTTVTTPGPTVTVTTPGPAIDRIVIKTVKVPARQGRCPKFTRRMSKTGRPLVCGKDVVKWRTPKATPRKTPRHFGTGVTG